MTDVRPARLAIPGFVIGLLPIVVVHASYLISAVEGHVDWCNPYWDGCSSISRAGRHGWAFFVFKAGMLPYASALAAYWWVCQRWLRSLGDRGSAAMLASGLVGVAFLVLYATFLGSDGPTYQWLRRTGIYFYFVGTFAAQALLVHRLFATTRNPAWRSERGGTWPGWLVPIAILLVALVIVLGLAFAIVGRALDIERDRLENAIEWVVSLAMQLSLLLTLIGWRATGLVVSIAVAPSRRADTSP